MELVERKITELGEFTEVQIGESHFTHSKQWVTFECGHKSLSYTDIAAFVVGTKGYCEHCGNIKNQLKEEVILEIKKKLADIL